MPLQATSGAASYDAFGGGVVAEPNYIESCFSTYLYTGTTSTQTFNNGVDLSGKGGLVWIKKRTDGYSHYLTDSSRGVGNYLSSNSTGAQNWAGTSTDSVTSFNTNGFTVGADTTLGWVNNGNINDKFVSWTFRKQPKFFDVVTYTGDGTNGRAISHSLDSTPGFIIVKSTSNAAQWVCWSRGFNSGNGYGYLNDTTAWFTSGEDVWGNGTSYIAPTSTTFTVKGGSVSNLSGRTYVAYLFAHNAGGFGLTGTDNVISCGSFTADGAGDASITLGYEPQWVMFKSTAVTGDWYILDNMRGWNMSANDQYLLANTSGAEATYQIGNPTATGFNLNSLSASTGYIYIAIRRGPMKVPTVGTSVFAPIARTGTGSIANVSVGFPPDFLTTFYRTDPGQDKVVFDRLRGPTQYLNTAATTQEINVSTNGLISFNNTTFTTNANGYANNSGSAFVNHVFGRAPSFFDEVCYTGVFSPQTINHNLGVAPQMIITKKRSSTSRWPVYHIGVPSPQVNQPDLNNTGGYYANDYYPGAPTSTTFTAQYQDTGSTYVAYLFATCAGVSKVGSYTGTGATQTINCGFGASGSRFVLVKRTDSTGDWYVWDSARGMVSGTDPSLLLNSTAAEVNANSVYAVSTGFQIVSTAAGINASGGSYIFLSVA